MLKNKLKIKLKKVYINIIINFILSTAEVKEEQSLLAVKTTSLFLFVFTDIPLLFHFFKYKKNKDNTEDCECAE
jgi:hypothetical protein